MGGLIHEVFLSKYQDIRVCQQPLRGTRAGYGERVPEVACRESGEVKRAQGEMLGQSDGGRLVKDRGMASRGPTKNARIFARGELVSTPFAAGACGLVRRACKGSGGIAAENSHLRRTCSRRFRPETSRRGVRSL